MCIGFLAPLGAVVDRRQRLFVEMSLDTIFEVQASPLVRS